MSTRDVVWQGMVEADTYRRYYSLQADRLRRLNTCLVGGMWGMSAVAAVVGILGYPTGSVVLVIAAAATTTLRDVLGLPGRHANVRFALVGLNEEYDALRLRWATGGAYHPPPELDTFRRVSRFTFLVDEATDGKLLKQAEEESREYHDQVEPPETEAFAALGTNQGAKA